MDKKNHSFIIAIVNDRISLTWLFAGVLFMLYCFGEDAWSARNIIFEKSLFFVGVVLVGVGVIGRTWCFSYIAGNKNRKLVTSGPYSLCRNPLYFFSLIAALGVGFCTETLTVPLIILLAFSAYYPFQIKKEEKVLRQRYGVQYERYCERVPGFIPSFASFREEETVLIYTRVFRKSISDLVVFIIMIGVLEYMEALHTVSWIGAYYKIY